jgi:hypothetical protein
MEVSGQLHTPAAFHPGKNPGTHCIQGWVVTLSQSGRFWRLENLLPLLIFEPRLVQPVASRYANCTALNPELVQNFSNVFYFKMTFWQQNPKIQFL